MGASDQDGLGPDGGAVDGACDCGPGCPEPGCWPEPTEGGGLKLGKPVGGVGGPLCGPGSVKPPAPGPEE